MATVFTIGFTHTTAESFFGRLREAGVKRLIDVRLNNVSQLAGFAKKEDLAFFLRELSGIDYRHELRLAPTAQILDAYRKRGIPAAEFEKRMRGLLQQRKVEKALSRKELDRAVLLCSEEKPEHCHRRVVAEYFAEKWGGLDICHL